MGVRTCASPNLVHLSTSAQGTRIGGLMPEAATAPADGGPRSRRVWFVLVGLAMVLVAGFVGAAWGQRHPVVNVDETPCLALDPGSDARCRMAGTSAGPRMCHGPMLTGAFTRTVVLIACHRQGSVRANRCCFIGSRP